MQKLQIELGSCVRVASKYSNCTLCSDICPIDAIDYAENIPLVSESCIDCGGCIGICPTEAISLNDFNTLDFIFDMLDTKEDIISCKKNIPCLATLSVENLISIGLLSEEQVKLDLGHCENCEIKEPLYQNILSNINEANSFLSNLESDKKVVGEFINYTPKIEEKESGNRRDFLKHFSLKGAVKSKVEFEKEIDKIEKRGIIDDSTTSKIKQKELPNKRKLLYMALKRIEKHENYINISEDNLSFISQKSIDDSCDNCSFCYRVCPTEALSTDRRDTKIHFDPLSCVKCRLCHDVCQTDSIHLEEFSTKNIFKPRMQELISFNVVRCDECANYFTYFGGEKMCHRCKLEEEEAKSLWGIK